MKFWKKKPILKIKMQTTVFIRSGGVMIKKIFFLIFFIILLGNISQANSIKYLFSKSDSKSFNIILRLAKKGDVKAMYYTGLSYETGNGISINYKKAAEWYKKAAEAGYSKAQYNLAFMYRYGYGVRKNLILSYKWFYILKNENECYLDSQEMTKPEIRKAIKLANEWIRKHSR